MLRHAILAAPLLLPMLVADGAESVVLGRALSNEETNIGMECPKEYLCMDTLVRWRIAVSQTLSGPAVSGQIVAIRFQHGSVVPAYLPRFKLFVLRPIEGESARQSMDAEFDLIDVSETHEMYCLKRKPQDLGLSADETFVALDPERQSYCFPAPEEPEP